MLRASRGGWFAKVAAVGTSVAVGLLAMAGAALASWTPIVTVTAPGWEGLSQTVAVDRYGDALLAWSALGFGTSGPIYAVQVRTRSRTGVLGPIETLSTPANAGPFLDAAISGDGAGVVAWASLGPGPVLARQVSASGKLGPLLTLTPPGVIAVNVTAAMSPTGEALVAWDGQDGYGSSVGTLARFISPDGTLGPVLAVGGGAFGALPRVVISSKGVATVAWADWSGAVARRLTPGSVSAPRVIMATGGTTSYGVGAISDDAGGDTVFAIIRVKNLSNGSQQISLMARVWRQGGTLGSAEQVAPSVNDLTSDVAVATDQYGNSVLAWTNYAANQQSYVYGRRVSLTGKLSTVATLGTGFAPEAITDPAGTGMAAWQTKPLPLPGGIGGQLAQIYGRPFAAATGAFGPQVTLTANGDFFDLAESPAGKIAAIWQKSTSPWPARARFGP